MTAAYSLIRRTIILLTILFAFTSFSFAAPVQTYDELLAAIRTVQKENAHPIESDMKQAGVREAWGIGQLINEYILLNKTDDQFPGRLFERLAQDLQSGASHLRRKYEFARAYREVPTTIHLTWSHYKKIFPINDPAERAEITAQAESGKWSIEKLREEIIRRHLKTDETETAVIAGRLTELKPGRPGLYKIVNLKGELKAELGFDVYRDAPHDGRMEWEEDQIVFAHGSDLAVEPAAKHEDLYTYNAVVLDVADGDTFRAAIDLGLNAIFVKSLRLRRVDAPELKAETGARAKAALENILRRNGGKIMLRVTRGNHHDIYGRYIADVFVNGKNIDQELVDTALFTIRS